MKKDLLFYLGLGLLFTHEMDAMPNYEWRVLPLLRALSDAAGESFFLLAHVPLFAVIAGLVASLNRRLRSRARFWFAVFLVVHSGLHFAFSGHHEYRFASFSSTLLIYGAAVCGALYLLLNYTEEPRGS